MAEIDTDTHIPVPHRDRDDESRKRRRGWSNSIAHYVPGFFYLLLFFILLKSGGLDLRYALIETENYAITPMYFLFLIAVAITGLEMLKVSHAGVNNIGEVIAMTVIAVIFLIFYFLGAGGVKVLWIFDPRTFGNSEFLALALCAIIEAIVAQVVNARTYGRAIAV